MSVAKGVPGPDGPQSGQKIVLSRAPRRMLRQIEAIWAGQQIERWRDLAMLQLIDHCGWTLTMAARSYGIHKGQASRRITECKRQLSVLIEEVHRDLSYGAEAEEFPADDCDEDFPTTADD